MESETNISLKRKLEALKLISSMNDRTMEPTYAYACITLTWMLLSLQTFGMIGNILIITIRSRPKMRSPVNFLLTALAIADLALGYLFFGAASFVPLGLYDGRSILSQGFQQNLVPVKAVATITFYPVALMFQTGSTYILVIVTIERYIAVCRPLSVKSFCTYRHQIIAIVIVIFFAVGFNACRFAENRLKFHNSTGQITGDKSAFRKNLGDTYRIVYLGFFNSAVLFLIPIVFFISLNTRIIIELQKSRKFRRYNSSSQIVVEGTTPSTASSSPRTSRSTTIMLLILTSVFLLSSIIPVGAGGYTTYQFWVLNKLTRQLANKAKNMTWFNTPALNELMRRFKTYPRDQTDMLRIISNIFIALNSSINFPIYYGFSSQFRNGFNQLFFPNRRTSTCGDMASFNPLMTNNNYSTRSPCGGSLDINYSSLNRSSGIKFLGQSPLVCATIHSTSNPSKDQRPKLSTVFSLDNPEGSRESTLTKVVEPVRGNSFPEEPSVVTPLLKRTLLRNTRQIKSLDLP